MGFERHDPGRVSRRMTLHGMRGRFDGEEGVFEGL
jgi:hypothetical protein